MPVGKQRRCSLPQPRESKSRSHAERDDYGVAPAPESRSPIWQRLKEMPLAYKAWHLVPLFMPLGLVLVLIGADSPHGWMVPTGIAFIAISALDIAIVFPLVMVRNGRRRGRKP